MADAARMVPLCQARPVLQSVVLLESDTASPFRGLSPTLGLPCAWERLTLELQAGNDKSGRPPGIGLPTGEKSTPLTHSTQVNREAAGPPL